MAEIEIALPTVRYGNVKVRATPEEFGFKLDEPSAFGLALAVYQTSFTLGWQEGARMDVSAPAPASQPVTEEQAQRYLDEGLGGVTEVSEGPLNQHPNDGPEESDDAPWNKTPAAGVKKPWETASAPADKPVVDDTW